MKCSSRLEREHCSDVRTAYHVGKVCLILRPSSRWDARLHVLQGAGLLLLAPFAYAVKRSDTRRRRLTFEFRADGVFAAPLPTPSSARRQRGDMWTSLLSVFIGLPGKGGAAVHICDILKLISGGPWKDSRIPLRHTVLIKADAAAGSGMAPFQRQFATETQLNRILREFFVNPVFPQLIYEKNLH